MRNPMKMLHDQLIKYGPLDVLMTQFLMQSNPHGNFEHLMSKPSSEWSCSEIGDGSFCQSFQDIGFIAIFLAFASFFAYSIAGILIITAPGLLGINGPPLIELLMN